MAGKKKITEKTDLQLPGEAERTAHQAQKSTDSTGSARKNSAGASGSKRSAASGSASSGEKPKKNPAGSRMRDEIVAIFMVALGIFLLASLMTEATGEFGKYFPWFSMDCLDLLLIYCLSSLLYMRSLYLWTVWRM